MISLFQLSFLFSVRAEGGNPDFLFDECWGLRADKDDEIAKCQRIFVSSVDIASRQVPPAHVIDDGHHQDYMPDNVQLTELDPANDGNMLDIIYFGSEPKAHSPEIDDWTFFTLQSQSIPAMKEAIRTLRFDTQIRKYDLRNVYTPEQANKMLTARIAALLGMPEGDYQFNLGKTVQKQFDVSDNVGWNPEKQQVITDNYDNTGFFRPCFNSFDIHSSKCHYVPEGSDSYDWVQQWAKKSYTGPGQVTADGTPFTGRGWTFDWQKWWHCDRERWNNCGGSQQDEIGLSEFVLPPHASSVQWTKTQTALDFFCEICKDDPDSCGNHHIEHDFSYWARGQYDNEGCGWNSSATQNEESQPGNESPQQDEVPSSDDAQQQNQNDDSQPQSESSQQDEVPTSDDAQQQNQNSQQDEVSTSDDAQQQNQNDDSQPQSKSSQQDEAPTSDDAQQQNQNDDSQPQSKSSQQDEVPSEENQNIDHEQDIHI
jgi:hypothetical protein